MPLDVLGCTCATLMRSTSFRSCPKWLGNLFKMHRDGVGKSHEPYHLEEGEVLWLPKQGKGGEG